MVACVGVVPMADASAGCLSLRAVSIDFDVARAMVALREPFVDTVWLVYVLSFLPDISRT